MSDVEDFMRLKRRIAEAKKDPVKQEALLVDARKALAYAKARAEIRRIAALPEEEPDDPSS